MSCALVSCSLADLLVQMQRDRKKKSCLLPFLLLIFWYECSGRVNIAIRNEQRRRGEIVGGGGHVSKRIETDLERA